VGYHAPHIAWRLRLPVLGQYGAAGRWVSGISFEASRRDVMGTARAQEVFVRRPFNELGWAYPARILTTVEDDALFIQCTTELIQTAAASTDEGERLALRDMTNGDQAPA